jgi:hypothetical protein
VQQALPTHSLTDEPFQNSRSTTQCKIQLSMPAYSMINIKMSNLFNNKFVRRIKITYKGSPFVVFAYRALFQAIAYEKYPSANPAHTSHPIYHPSSSSSPHVAAMLPLWWKVLHKNSVSTQPTGYKAHGMMINSQGQQPNTVNGTIN